MFRLFEKNAFQRNGDCSFSVGDTICLKRCFGYGKSLVKQIWLNTEVTLPIKQSKLVHEPCGQQGEVCILYLLNNYLA